MEPPRPVTINTDLILSQKKMVIALVAVTSVAGNNKKCGSKQDAMDCLDEYYARGRTIRLPKANDLIRNDMDIVRD